MIEPVIDKFDQWDVSCSACGEVTRHAGRYNVLIRLLQKQGWSIGKSSRGWTHICPDCVERAAGPAPGAAA
jgi:hypothetical protein